MSEEFNYYIIENRIHCGDCSKSYELKKDGLPPKNFFSHQYRHCRVSTKSCIENFLKKYKMEREREQEPEPEKKDIVECSICYENIVSDCCSIPCKHKFHVSCLKKMNNDMCPLCRCVMGINRRIGIDMRILDDDDEQAFLDFTERRRVYQELRRQNHERMRQLEETRRQYSERLRQLEEEQRKMRNGFKEQKTLMEIFERLDQERTMMYANGIYHGQELDTINERINENIVQREQIQQIISQIQQRINEMLVPRELLNR